MSVFRRLLCRFSSAVKKIDSFETLTLTLTGMRHCTEYIVVADGDEASVGRYEVGREKNIPTGSAKIPLSKMISRLNEFGVAGWDGFHGPHPKRIRDGTMFRLNVDLGNGKTVRADGSQNVPPHFRDLVDFLREITDGDPGGNSAEA